MTETLDSMGMIGPGPSAAPADEDTSGSVATTPEIRRLLDDEAPVSIGVSGGKDSSAVAFEVRDYLDAIGHRGPRVLTHSDLGRVEWRDSLPTCERLAKATGLDLVVVRRKAGDMMDRWLVRWRNNVERYASLSCVKLILPWSTPSMRFCTSELKVDVICRELVARFPGETILNVSGIRRAESAQRKHAPVAKAQPKLSSQTHGTDGLDWNAIVHRSTEDVFEVGRRNNFPLHEAYTKYGSGRVSCVFCIMGSKSDLRAAAGCEDNHDVYREMVDLEIASTFAFQGDEWLGDVSPGQRSGLERAKAAAKVRQTAEARIPKHLLYTKNWPTCIPTADEAWLLAEVRREVAAAVGLEIGFTDPASIVARYEELMAEKEAKEAVKRRRPRKAV
jgi:3'-phosphoadenosine 5'-phosphosulfate sulfotransferase (PAPS reductase)/FAD synthetase